MNRLTYPQNVAAREKAYTPFWVHTSPASSRLIRVGIRWVWPSTSAFISPSSPSSLELLLPLADEFELEDVSPPSAFSSTEVTFSIPLLPDTSGALLPRLRSPSDDTRPAMLVNSTPPPDDAPPISSSAIVSGLVASKSLRDRGTDS